MVSSLEAITIMMFLLLIAVLLACGVSGLDFSSFPIPVNEERIKKWFRVEKLPSEPRRFTNITAEQVFDLVRPKRERKAWHA